MKSHTFTRPQGNTYFWRTTRARRLNPREFKLVPLRECRCHDDQPRVDTPEQAADYWRQHIATEARYNPHRECAGVGMMNVRRRLLGQGTKDGVLVSVGEMLQPAVLADAAALLLMHNHPSGDPSPSESDIKLTRDLRQAGLLLKIEVLDHVIMGRRSRKSKRDWAYRVNRCGSWAIHSIPA